MMRFIFENSSFGRDLFSAFNELSLWYGDAGSYASLVSPAFVEADAPVAASYSRDASLVAELYDAAATLYGMALRAEAPRWFQEIADFGHSHEEVLAHRRVLSNTSPPTPVLNRIDYVGLGPEPNAIAEVQWKSGGPGFFLGHDDAYSHVLGASRSGTPEGSLTDRYIRTLAGLVPEGQAIVNEGRAEWLKSEAFLERRASELGGRYWAVDRARFSEGLELVGQSVRFRRASRPARVGVIRGREYTARLRQGQLSQLVERFLAGDVWLEAPPNLIYRQKWPLSLPFLPGHAHATNPNLRLALIPTGLLTKAFTYLQPVFEALGAADAWTEHHVGALTSLAELPAGLRSRIVLKCAAGSGPLQSGGRGVIRLAGSRGQVLAKLAPLAPRIAAGEPWIAQPYVDRPMVVPLSHPGNLSDVRWQEARVRLMVFSHRDSCNAWHYDGAIANVGPHWKIGGAAAGYAADGSLTGTAFCSVRAKAS